jgi:integrase
MKGGAEMASIRKRGDLQWEARIRRKGWPVTCKTFTTKSDAEKWARDIETEMDRGIFTSRAEAESTTLSEALERFIVEYVPRYNNPKLETIKVRGIQRRKIASKFMAAIRSKDIAEEREAEGVAGNTVRIDLAILSRVFNLAASSWGMESLRNPVSRVPRPKISNGRTRRLEGDEEERLLAECPDSLRPIISFAIETAMRRGEIASLKWQHIDLDRRTAYLPKTKNSEERTVPLSPAAVAILKEMDRGEDTRVFKLSDVSITQAFIRTCQKTGIEGLTFYDLRHEGTSRLFEHTDLDIMEIKSITGHKTLQMLARYSHLRTFRLVDRLAGAKRGEFF